MWINSIELCNFRNYDREKLEFHKNSNVLYGDNAQGKTNILEAIFVCGTTKSHKGSKEKELIKLGQDEAHLRMMLTKNDCLHRVDMQLSRNQSKRIAIDGVPIHKSSELMGFIHLIFFSPEDLKIIKNGPAERRRFLNMELCQLDPLYLHDLGEYNKVLNQRNKLLKQIYFQPDLKDTLEIWDKPLLESGKNIIQRREVFIQQIKDIVYQINRKLTQEKEELLISYEPNVTKDAFEKKLKESLEKDLKMCNTNVGPHRDDISFQNGTIDIRQFGSQGQQRTSALSLKLAEIELVKSITGEKPVLLLDDVLSELDQHRHNSLLDSIHGIQTLVTCTGMEDFVSRRMQIDRVFHINQGKATQESMGT
jgi:DNA replication and repair protein RecF